MFLDCLGQKVSREDASNKAEHEGIQCGRYAQKSIPPRRFRPDLCRFAQRHTTLYNTMNISSSEMLLQLSLDSICVVTAFSHFLLFRLKEQQIYMGRIN